MKTGDTVAYSANFLRSIGVYTGPIPQARGVIVEIESHGTLQLARIDWGAHDMPERVLLSNLAKVGTPAMSAN